MQRKLSRSFIMIASIGLASIAGSAYAAPADGSTSSNAPAATAETPSIGRPAPDFSLTGEDGKSYRLKDLAGRWVVLAFYPADFTRG